MAGITDRFIAKLRVRDEVSDAEAAAVEGLVNRTRDYPADTTVVRAGEELTESLLLVDGFAYRYKDLRDGRRQILELNLPGDFVDLHGFVLKRIDHSVATLTPATIAFAAHDDLRRVTVEMPHLGRLLWFQTALDAAIHREWITTLGQKSATGRLAQLFCELRERLAIGGLVEGDRFHFPLTQAELGEVTGLTSVHVNRTLKSLREAGLVTIDRGAVAIHDLVRLKREAEFDPTYLSLEKRPR